MDRTRAGPWLTKRRIVTLRRRGPSRARCACALALALAAPTSLGAASPGGPPAPLELAPLLAELRARNPSVDGARARLEAARVAIRRARAWPNPLLSAALEDLALERGTMPMVRIAASGAIPFPGKLARTARVAGRVADAEAARVDRTLLDVLTVGRRLYYALFLNAEEKRINREHAAVVATLVDLAAGRLAAGMPMHHDVLKMRTEAAMVEAELAMIDGERREMAAMLNALRDRPADLAVGEPGAAWTRAAGWDRAALWALAATRRPELREMGAMAAAEHAMADVARREYFPDLMVGALYDLRLGGPDAAGVMVGVEVPLFIPWKERLDVRVAELRARAAERERDGMAAMVRGEIESSLAAVAAAEGRLSVLAGEWTRAAQETFDAAVAAFPAGGTSALEVLDALRALLSARLEVTSARIERELAIVGLARAVGVAPEELP